MSDKKRFLILLVLAVLSIVLVIMVSRGDQAFVRQLH